MRYLYKSILLDLIFIVYGIFLLTNKYLNLEAINIEFIKNIFEINFIQNFLNNVIIQTGVLFILYGIVLALSYLGKKETVFGESRLYELIIGISLVLIGPAMIYFNNQIIDYFNYMLAFFAIVHGIAKFCYNPHQGDFFRTIQFVFSALLIVFGLLMCNFFKQEMFDNIGSFWYLGLIVSGIDILLFVISCILPRDDFEDTSVKVKYSSYEDRIILKNNNKNINKKKKEPTAIDKIFDEDVNR